MTADLGQFRLNLRNEAGAKVTAVHGGGLDRNLLFAPGSPLLLDDDGDTFSVVGWDEAFPTVAASGTYPAWGSVWRAAAASSKTCPESLTSRWRVAGFAFERRLSAEDDALEAQCMWTNETDAPLPALWAAHVLYPAEGLQELRLPGGEPVAGPQCVLHDLMRRVHRQGGEWRVCEFADIGLSWKFYLPAHGPVRLRYDDAEVELETETGWWGVFLNRGRFGAPCVGIEPTTHPTDYAHEAALLGPDKTHTACWRLRLLG